MGKFGICTAVSLSISSISTLELSSWLRYRRDNGLWGGESCHGCCSRMNAVEKDSIHVGFGLWVMSDFEDGERW